MSKLFLAALFSMAGYLTGWAQYLVEIQGSTFNIELDDQNMTAAIRDYNYEIDDAKFPIKNKTRKFKGFSQERSRTVIIPESYKTTGGKEYTITTIGKSAFAGYSNMDYIVIPTTVTTIEDYAFFRSSLISVDIPASVSQIGDRAFGWCTKLRSLKVPQGISMGHDLCTESKGIDVKYYAVADKPEVPAKDAIAKATPKKPQPKKFATSSDVDVDLPTANKENDEMFAIIIANENYQKVAKVDCALSDGRTFQRYCQQVLGIPSDNIHMIEDATYGQMLEEFNWLSRVAKAYEGDAKIIVYYAGHGIPNESNRTAYLLPVDVSGDNTAGAFSLNKLYASLGELNAKNVILFMDACFSGSIRGEGMLTAARGVAIKAKNEDPLGNMIVFSAAQGDETAHPYAEKGHGLFTYYLLKKLKETRGNVNLGTLGDYIKKEVGRKSIVANNKPQTPTVSYSSRMKDCWRNILLK